jgi:hypothetical protein
MMTELGVDGIRRAIRETPGAASGAAAGTSRISIETFDRSVHLMS